MSRRLGSKQLLVVGLMMVGLIGAFVGGAYGSHVFTDVPTSAYYHDDVTWLANTGVTSGCGGGKYCPNNPVTRGQMATFLHKLAGSTRTGHFSCDAYAFTAANSTITYNNDAGVHANGEMACGINVPDGATITKFTATFKDTSAADASCQLVRASQSEGTLADYQDMAFVQTNVSSPAETRLTDTSVGFQLVDNNLYSYLAVCLFGGLASPSTALAVTGVIVEYTYKGVPAP